jgi:hypothetical protein
VGRSGTKVSVSSGAVSSAKCRREQALKSLAPARKAGTELSCRDRRLPPEGPRITLAFHATSSFKVLGFFFFFLLLFVSFILVHRVLWPYSPPITLFGPLLHLLIFSTSPVLCVHSRAGLTQGTVHKCCVFIITRPLQFHSAQPVREKQNKTNKQQTKQKLFG